MAALKGPSMPAGGNAGDPYQIEDDVRTLVRAHAIRSDPKRHKAAKAHAKKQLAAVQAAGGVQPMDDDTKSGGKAY